MANSSNILRSTAAILLLLSALAGVMGKSSISNVALLANPPPAEMKFPEYRTNPECPPLAYTPASFMIHDFDASINTVNGQKFLDISVKGNVKGTGLKTVGVYAKIVYNGWPFDYHIDDLCKEKIHCPVTGDYDFELKFELPSNLPEGTLSGIVELRDTGVLLNCESFHFNVQKNVSSAKMSKVQKLMKTEF